MSCSNPVTHAGKPVILLHSEHTKQCRMTKHPPNNPKILDTKLVFSRCHPQMSLFLPCSSNLSLGVIGAFTMYNCSLSRSDISSVEATQDLRALGFALPVRYFSRRARHCLEPQSSPHDPRLTRPVNSKLTFLGKRTKSREAAKRSLGNSASLQQGNRKKSHPIGASTGNSPEPTAEYNCSRSPLW